MKRKKKIAILTGGGDVPGLNACIKQVDVALDPTAAEVKLPGERARKSADVLVFPNLDAAYISALHPCSKPLWSTFGLAVRRIFTTS